MMNWISVISYLGSVYGKKKKKPKQKMKMTLMCEVWVYYPFLRSH